MEFYIYFLDKNLQGTIKFEVEKRHETHRSNDQNLQRKKSIINLCRNMDCSIFNLEGSNVVFNNILEIVSMSNFSLNQEAVDVK